MNIVGMTGGIASGKSEVGRRLTQRGIPVIDADTVAHEVMAPGGAAYQPVVDAFGSGILRGESIDRETLGAIVFNNPEKLKTLNGLVHPAVMGEIGARCARLAQDGAPAVVVDAALLGDNGAIPEFMAGLILVLCPDDVRVARMVEHRDMTEEDARTRIAAQVDPESKRPLARWIIENDGSIEALYTQADTVADELLAGTG